MNKASLAVKTSIGKKYTIYLPKAVVKALNLREGEKIILRVVGNSLVIEALHDPIQLALSTKKFASVTPEEVEAISIGEQMSRVKGDS